MNTALREALLQPWALLPREGLDTAVARSMELAAAQPAHSEAASWAHRSAFDLRLEGGLDHRLRDLIAPWSQAAPLDGRDGALLALAEARLASAKGHWREARSWLARSLEAAAGLELGRDLLRALLVAIRWDARGRESSIRTASALVERLQEPRGGLALALATAQGLLTENLLAEACSLAEPLLDGGLLRDRIEAAEILQRAGRARELSSVLSGLMDECLAEGRWLQLAQVSLLVARQLDYTEAGRALVERAFPLAVAEGAVPIAVEAEILTAHAGITDRDGRAVVQAIEGAQAKLVGRQPDALWVRLDLLRGRYLHLMGQTSSSSARFDDAEARAKSLNRYDLVELVEVRRGASISEIPWRGGPFPKLVVPSEAPNPEGSDRLRAALASDDERLLVLLGQESAKGQLEPELASPLAERLACAAPNALFAAAISLSTQADAFRSDFWLAACAASADQAQDIAADLQKALGVPAAVSGPAEVEGAP